MARAGTCVGGQSESGGDLASCSAPAPLRGAFSRGPSGPFAPRRPRRQQARRSSSLAWLADGPDVATRGQRGPPWANPKKLKNLGEMLLFVA